jgi:hypothetical protein
MRLARFFLIAAPLLAGCPNTDTAIFVDPSIDGPQLTVQSSALGTGVKGAFTLKLHLGARASGPSMVSLGQFEIQDANKTGAIVSPLALDAGGTQFPVEVMQDSDVTVTLTFDTGSKLLAADIGKKLCDAAGVLITGSIEDSLQDTATPVTSGVVHAAGCQ